jgi:hypothetical protein
MLIPEISERARLSIRVLPDDPEIVATIPQSRPSTRGTQLVPSEIPPGDFVPQRTSGAK